MGFIQIAAGLLRLDLLMQFVSGFLLSGIFFASKVQRMSVERNVSADGRAATYRVSGEIFFASVDRLTRTFGADEQVERIRIDVAAAHLWDISAVAALDKIVARLRRSGVEVEVVGYNKASADLVDGFALHNKTGVEIGVVPH